MAKNAITIKQSVIVNKPKEVVWDYTQNYVNRPLWDSSVQKAEVIETQPCRVVKLRAQGNTVMTFVYKQDEKPHKTTLAAKEVQSPFMESGGGSWLYEEENNGQSTKWTQTNTIVFKKSLFLPLLLPIYKWVFQNQTTRAMHMAKLLIERVN